MAVEFNGFQRGILRVPSYEEWEAQEENQSLGKGGYSRFFVSHFAPDVQKLVDLTTTSRKMIVMKNMQGQPYLDFSYGDADQWGGRFIQTVCRTTRTCLATVNLCNGGGNGKDVLEHIHNIQQFIMTEGLLDEFVEAKNDQLTLLTERFREISQQIWSIGVGIRTLDMQYSGREDLVQLIDGVKNSQQVLERSIEAAGKKLGLYEHVHTQGKPLNTDISILF